MRYLERNYNKRMLYLRQLREVIKTRGSSNIVYVDESGFDPKSQRNYGWALRGKRIYGEKSGNTRPRTSLIAGRRGNKLLAPVLFKGSTNGIWFDCWLEEHLFPELSNQSTIIMDNAPFHGKNSIREICKKHGHHVLFLSPYSPDFNPIEKCFANIKKIRSYAAENISLDQIIKTYAN